ncbi:MAG: hypothetical protein A2Z06_02685, partial [Candidatus Glassbacteria bacterium RBG_16_58_8]
MLNGRSSKPWRKTGPVVLLALLAIFAGARAQAIREDGSYSCTLCHSKIKAQFLDDIHFKRGITCDRCHGGDPGAFEMEGAKAPSTRYRGKLSKAEGVRLCASCHSDEEMMRQYGLSTDQYQQFAVSEHGRMLLGEGNADVAACVDCHGVHLILPPSDPSSQVFRKNLPYTCAKCHSDEAYMAPYGTPTNQLDDYLQSVHGTELIEKNNRAVPECARCHGVHGASAPGTTEVYNVCGQCHPFIREQFMKSPHFEAEKEGLIEGCVACHGSHRIVRADSELFVKSCQECHARDSQAFRAGTEMKDLIDGAWRRYAEGRTELDRAMNDGLIIVDEELMLEEAHTLLINLRTVQHTIDVRVVEGEVAKAKSIVNGVITTL